MLCKQDIELIFINFSVSLFCSVASLQKLSELVLAQPTVVELVILIVVLADEQVEVKGRQVALDVQLFLDWIRRRLLQQLLDEAFSFLKGLRNLQGLACADILFLFGLFLDILNVFHLDLWLSFLFLLNLLLIYLLLFNDFFSFFFLLSFNFLVLLLLVLLLLDLLLLDLFLLDSCLFHNR